MGLSAKIPLDIREGVVAQAAAYRYGATVMYVYMW